MFHITTCIDGDHTTLAGRDCWQDARFADAVSMTMRLHAVPAIFVGREEGWEARAAERCEDDPPDPSLFDPS